METKTEPIIGYFLLVEAWYGSYPEDTEQEDIRSWFIEKNSETEEAFKQICEESCLGIHDFNKLLTRGYYETSYLNRSSYHLLHMHHAVKIGDEIFKKVEMINKK